MTTKQYILDFANPSLSAADRISDIRKACVNAAINLDKKFGIKLGVPIVMDNGQVVVSVDIPDKNEREFNAGRRLRGISKYLLDKCDFPYREYLIGRRLLFYFHMSGFQSQITTPSQDEYGERWTLMCSDKNGHEWYIVERFLIPNEH